MIADVRQLLEVRPFKPFSIVTSAGKHYSVATADHAAMNPQQTRVIVFFDDDSHVAIAPLHIASIEHEMQAE
jgi:hypothetical protein